MNKVLSGKKITMSEAKQLLELDDKHTMELAGAANTICREMNGDVVDVECLINAKSGNCAEDCAFCAQSSRYKTDIKKYPFLSKDIILDAAARAKNEPSVMAMLEASRFESVSEARATKYT